MGALPGSEHQYPAAEVQALWLVEADQSRRPEHSLSLVRPTQFTRELVGKKEPGTSDRPFKLLVTNYLWRVCRKSHVAEQVVIVHVGVNDVTDWQGGYTIQRPAEALPDLHRTTGVDNGDATLADHGNQVRNVVTRRMLATNLSAAMNENAGRDLC